MQDVESQAAWNANHTRPAAAIPAGAVDCHMHVMGDVAAYPPSPRRSYTPRPASLADWDAMARTAGLARHILVQASAYGADNRCLLDALKARGPARARGVAMIDETVNDLALQDMHAAGVRGVRVNAATFSVEDPKAVAAQLEDTFRRVAPLGWHVQLFAALPVIENLTPLLQSAPVPIVLDHMGLAKAASGPRQPGFEALVGLLRSGRGWVKLSGCYRISERAPDYPDVAPIVHALIDANPERVIWGTDWPHTGAHGSSVKTGEAPVIAYRPLDDGHLLSLFADWCGDAGTLRRILVDNPGALYGF